VTATSNSTQAATPAATPKQAPTSTTTTPTQVTTPRPSSAQVATPGASAAGPAYDPALSPVTFRMFAAARAASGCSQVDVTPGPACEVVSSLAAGLPPRFADVLAISSLVTDGHRLDPSSPAPIPGGSVIDVLPPFAGG
jgi:molybdopterin converting factor small subunit